MVVIFILAVFGLAGGSFINALVWRVHELDQSKKLSAKKRRALSMVHGRSMCPNCQHTLAWYDLIPVVSWLFLRGRCRYCHKPIPDSPLVELGTAAVFVGSYYYWPQNLSGQGLFDFIVWLMIIVGLVALVVYDLRWMLLPNKVVYPLFYIAVLAVVADTMIFKAGGQHLLQAAYGALIGGGIFYILFQVSKGTWIGGGDVRLGALLGLLVGDASKSFLIIFLSSPVGSLVAIPMLMMRKVKGDTRIPFGPFLILAAVIAKLFGTALLNWYKHKFSIY